MKRLLLLILFIVLYDGVFAQFSNNSRLWNIDFTYLADKINLRYDFVNCNPGDNYVVWVEAYFENGSKIETKSMIGDIGSVSAGMNKQIIWDIKKDGLLIEQSIYFKIIASKVPSSNLGTGLLYSTIFPGSGLTQVGARKNHFLIGALGYGALGSALVFNGIAANSMNKYKSSMAIPRLNGASHECIIIILRPGKKKPGQPGLVIIIFRTKPAVFLSSLFSPSLFPGHFPKVVSLPWTHQSFFQTDLLLGPYKYPVVYQSYFFLPCI